MTKRAIEAELISGEDLYRRVVLEKLLHARESVLISTANVKAMMLELNGVFRPVADAFSTLAKRGVSVRVLHAELPSRPFREAFDRHQELVQGAMTLKLCPRVHFKAVLVDGAWLYLGSANLTGAGLGAKGEQRRNFEAGIWSESPELVARLARFFASIWDGALCEGCGRQANCPEPLEEPDFG